MLQPDEPILLDRRQTGIGRCPLGLAPALAAVGLGNTPAQPSAAT
jgi:hypothetical protein